MILTTHALVGAALGKHITNPWVLISIAIPLHFTLDIFRHGEYLDKYSKVKEVLGKVAIDLTFGLTIIFAYILYFNPSTQIIRSILLGSFISMFPDLITFLHWKLKVPGLKKIYRFHKFVHSRFTEGSKERQWNLRNAVNDIAFTILAIILLIL